MCASVVVAADVAVGCPFGGEERGGRVLIFNGNRDVATKGLTLSQELRAAWTPRGSTPGYGFTLRGGQDLDNNQYPGKYSLRTSRSSTIRFPRCNQNSFSDLHSFSSPLFLPVPLSRAPTFLTSTVSSAHHPRVRLYRFPPPLFSAKAISQMYGGTGMSASEPLLHPFFRDFQCWS